MSPIPALSARCELMLAVFSPPANCRSVIWVTPARFNGPLGEFTFLDAPKVARSRSMRHQRMKEAEAAWKEVLEICRGCPTHSRGSNEWVPRVTAFGTSQFGLN